ncbi:hypothetical protein [Dactylosporangium sp. NPDC051541]|uniref:hypothetical protein n=1 Tax=Dactylosporangium sp. NPDC051541 TaxID=3363977 RepID=UPI0037923149
MGFVRGLAGALIRQLAPEVEAHAAACQAKYKCVYRGGGYYDRWQWCNVCAYPGYCEWKWVYVGSVYGDCKA